MQTLPGQGTGISGICQQKWVNWDIKYESASQFSDFYSLKETS